MFLLMTIFVHGMQDGNHIGSWRKHVFLQDVHHRLLGSVKHFSILELDIVDIWGENMLKYERHCSYISCWWFRTVFHASMPWEYASQLTHSYFSDDFSITRYTRLMNIFENLRDVPMLRSNSGHSPCGSLPKLPCHGGIPIAGWFVS